MATQWANRETRTIHTHCPTSLPEATGIHKTQMIKSGAIWTETPTMLPTFMGPFVID